MSDKPNYEIFQNKTENPSENHEESHQKEGDVDYDEPSLPPITQAVKVLPWFWIHTVQMYKIYCIKDD